MDPATVKSGQYGLNAALVGTALVGAFDLDFPETGNLESAVPVLLFLSFALAPSTVLVESLWTKKAPSSIPSLLLPFNSVLLATTVGASVWNRAMETQVVFLSPVAGMDVYDEEPSDFKILHASLNGLLRIFSVDGNSFGGILVLIGVSLCSRIVAASLFAGSFVATVVLGYVIFEESSWYLNSGYAGFTPALVCAGIFYYLVPSWKLTGLAFFGVVNAVILQGAVDVVLGLL
jgi:urea transporter